tara:strand:+ start:122 stop:307 length:186 start_codon:yes stop_codon:yes gene_type:complete
MAMTKEEVVARKIEKMFLARDLDLVNMGMALVMRRESELQTMEEILESVVLARQEQGVKQS